MTPRTLTFLVLAMPVFSACALKEALMDTDAGAAMPLVGSDSGASQADAGFRAQVDAGVAPHNTIVPACTTAVPATNSWSQYCTIPCSAAADCAVFRNLRSAIEGIPFSCAPSPIDGTSYCSAAGHDPSLGIDTYELPGQPNVKCDTSGSGAADCSDWWAACESGAAGCSP
jgi:hypothetical protein